MGVDGVATHGPVRMWSSACPTSRGSAARAEIYASAGDEPQAAGETGYESFPNLLGCVRVARL
jgi:hypothetical protein